MDASVQVKGVSHLSADKEKERRETLARLMEQYGSRLLRLCALYLRDAALAQDAVQETFLKAYRHYDQYRGEASEVTWLSRIAVNQCRDALRSPWHRHVNRRTPVDSLPEGASAFAFPDDTVLTAVMALPEKYRQAVLLRYYQGLKLTQIASVLGVSEGAVRKRLHRANGILRERLKEWYYDEEE